MLYELVFRGSLVQYWKVAYTEWQRPSRKDPLAQKPFRLSHLEPPEEFEEVTIEFLDEQQRLGLVTVDALSGADGKSIKLIIHVQRDAYEESGKSALSKWNKLKNAWERKGWLIDPLAPIQQRVVKPKKTAKPKSGSHLNLWFNWHDKMHVDGFKCTLKEISEETRYSYGRIRILYANYKKERGIQKT